MVTTTAELEERVTHRLEHARRVTYRSYLWAGAGLTMIPLFGVSARLRDGRLEAGPGIAAAAAGLAVFLWYYRRLLRDGLGDGASRTDLAVSGVVACGLTVLMPMHPAWIVIMPLWVSVAALSVRTRWATALLCAGGAVICAWAATAASGPGSPWYPRPWLVVVFLAVCAVAAWGNRYQLRIWFLHREAHAAREAMSRLAVTEERLRFSRDLHDLLGHSLSLIAVKSELAMRLADGDPAAARAEMADVHRAAREALREVRVAVRGYRAADLDAELSGVRGVLEAAGVRCVIGRPPSRLGEADADVLAWVVREGATNVLKHSTARHCTVGFTERDGAVIAEMTNDARPTRYPATSGRGTARA
ncbi:MAG: sensor histidine kinase [Streptosporangiales bacterium]|nr:sensor histidine kinase [Streptosporangiales bacterium]